MARNFVCLLVFCYLQFLIVNINGNGLYSITAPGTLRSNYKYNVAVTVHKADGPSQIKVGLTGPSYNETKTIEVQPMTTENVEFDVPKLKNGDYNLTAVGLSGVVFENTTKLSYADYKPSTFIQTDKATYKPGDLVRFRVVCLDHNTRPAKIQGPISIGITDGARNRLKQWKDIKLTKGVYSGEYQLSEQPVLGEWELEVKIDDENPTSKKFDVDKYVLPKFEVTVESAPDIAKADGVLKGIVRAKYTYGKGVKGKATVSIEPSYRYYSSSSLELKAQKTIDVDGKGHFSFDLVKDLQVDKENKYLPPLKITAILEEELTGNKQNSTTNVRLHDERFKIESVDSPTSYHPNKPVTIKIVVKNLDGTPVQDEKNKAKLTVEGPHSYFNHRAYPLGPDGVPVTMEPETKDMEFESNLDKNGMATFEFVLPESNQTYFSLKCSFGDTTKYISSISKYRESSIEAFTDLFKVIVNSKKATLDKPVAVEVKSIETIPYFVYVITARGNIVKTGHVTVPEGKKSHTIMVNPTFEMMPKATFYALLVVDNNLRFEEATIEFEKDFENKIEIEAPPQAKPGEDVKLNVKTDPESYVGLLGVDQSVLLLKSGNDFSKDAILNSLNDYNTATPWQHGYGRYPGFTSGLVTLTNAHYEYNTDYIIPLILDSPGFPVAVAFGLAEGAGVLPQSIQVRKEFPENWIFDDIENTDSNGLIIQKKIPDTITSWVVTGFSLNPKTGFALTEDPTKIKVFQPFFISTNLPYSVKRGEVIAIPAIIFNYMEKNLEAEVTMDNTDGEFEFTEATNEVEENPINEVKRVKRVTVPSNTGKSVSFMIRPKKVGDITLKITAVTPLAGDAIHKSLKVEPEGVTTYENRAVFINLKDQPEQQQKLSIDIPTEAVPDSEYIEFSAIGDLLGPTLKNLDKLVRMPYGCGEQNMVNFVPNILVLKYLDTIKQNMPSVVEKAKKFLEIGYQRELTYKHDDGSYSAFGKSDAHGSTWLTAYVVRSFRQAAQFTDIDPKVIKEGLDFLASKQAENGNFPEHGKLFDSAHQNELGLTSFVTLAFLENKEQLSEYKENLDKALKYITENVDKTDDQYSLSIAAYALQSAKVPSAEKVLAKLDSVAKEESDRKWWSKADKSKEDDKSVPYYWRPRSNDVEITSYVILAKLQTEPADKLLPSIKWLIAQRNSNGGFSSTQDTVMGLQALTNFAEQTGAGSGECDIDFTYGNEPADKGHFKIDKDNSLILQTHVLPKSARQLDFTAKGKGSSMVQLSYRYNLAEKDKQPSFKVKSTVKDNTLNQQLYVEICAEYVPLEAADQTKDSNMAVMEISLPSGYTADAEAFNKIEAVDRVKRTETKNSDSTVIVYFDSLPPKDVKCVPVEASKTHAVAKQKPAAVTIYDYYDANRRATEYYEVKSSLCDICEGEDCGAGCKK